MLNPHAIHWVLVADSGQARILEFKRKPYAFRQVVSLVSETQHQPSRDIVSDGSGRAFHSQGPASHSKQPRSDPHEMGEQQFTRSLAKRLEKAGRVGAFDHLIVIADPKTLGRLRRQMAKSLSGRVTDEITLDLSGLPLNELEPRVRSVMGWSD